MVHCLSVQSLTAEKAWWQESEAADHIVSIVRMQRRNAVSAKFLFFLSPGLQLMEWHCPMLSVGLSSSDKPFWKHGNRLTRGMSPR